MDCLRKKSNSKQKQLKCLQRKDFSRYIHVLRAEKTNSGDQHRIQIQNPAFVEDQSDEVEQTSADARHKLLPSSVPEEHRSRHCTKWKIVVMTMSFAVIVAIIGIIASFSQSGDSSSAGGRSTSEIPHSSDKLLDGNFEKLDKLQAHTVDMAATSSPEFLTSHSNHSAPASGTSKSSGALRPSGSKCRPGTSFYEAFGLPAPPETPDCYISHVDEVEPWDSAGSTKVVHHVCPQQQCGYNTAAVSKYFTTPKFKKKVPHLKGLVVNMIECDDLEIGEPNQIPEFNSLRALEVNFREKRQNCVKLYQNISLWTMPNLGLVVLRNVVISKSNENDINGILNRPGVRAVAICNSQFCLDCEILKGMDLRELDTLYLYPSNPEEESVIQRSKQIMDGAENVEHLVTNIALTTRELGNYMARLQKLVTGNFTVSIQQRNGRANFRLSTTLSSDASHLDIHLNVTNKVGVEPVVIYVHDAFKAGPKLDCITIRSPGNAIKLNSSSSGDDNVCWEYTITEGKLSCCRG